MRKFIEFADRYTQYCYNTNHIIRVAWDVDTDIIQIETVGKAFNHYFEDADTAKFVYYNHIMSNLIEEV
jgi:hypothetical protein